MKQKEKKNIFLHDKIETEITARSGMELTKGVCWIVSCSTQIHCEAYPKKDWKWFSSTHNASCSAAIWLTQLQIWGKKQQLCSPRFLCRQETVYSTTKPMKPFYESEVSKLNIKGLQPPPIVFFHTTGFPNSEENIADWKQEHCMRASWLWSYSMQWEYNHPPARAPYENRFKWGFQLT